MVFIVRDRQPGERPLGGSNQGNVSGAVVNGPGQEDYASLVVQELGHGFTLVDHSPEPDISERSAFDLLNRRSISNPKAVMFAFVGPDRTTLFDAAQWKVLRTELLKLNSTGPR